MNKDEIQKLIGGYATGSLTEEERRILFEAALEDQELFDVLQQEQPLKELFDDPFSREQVRRAAEESLPAGRGAWFRRPWIWALGASVAAAAVLTVGLVQWSGRGVGPRGHDVAKERGQERRSEGVEELRRGKSAVAQNRPPVPQTPPALKPAAKPNVSARAREPELDKTVGAPPPQVKRGEPTMTADNGGPVIQKREATDRPLALAVPPPTVRTPFRNDSQPSQQQAAPPPAPPPTEVQSVDGLARNQVAVQDQQRSSGGAQSTTQMVQVTPSAAPPPTQEVAPGVAQTKQKSAAASRAGPLFRARAGGVSISGFAAASPSVTVLIEKKLENGAYTNAVVNEAIPVGTVIRLTIAPRVRGAVTISESDELNPEWRSIFAPSQENAQLKPFINFAVPVDIVVKKGERLRVEIGSAVTDIPIKTEDAK